MMILIYLVQTFSAVPLIIWIVFNRSPDNDNDDDDDDNGHDDDDNGHDDDDDDDDDVYHLIYVGKVYP